ncbi:hypothetical protein KIN20_001574 [Parelaphostrongylus tenuis]|uniref:Protein kinase domain-containing protein n=1 Tax=Parelaphostrongylus tenuis TaxID=148309 RepID=A0AAD5MCZ7_PARTN|nr:hypothetical protein KIN20_001574 [Parelaphostrongylus tenuis]
MSGLLADNNSRKVDVMALIWRRNRGFAIVFAAYDNSNKWYALKRQLAQDEDSMEAVLREIRILKELSGHPAVLRFIAAAQMKLPSAGVEFMLLTELCSG